MVALLIQVALLLVVAYQTTTVAAESSWLLPQYRPGSDVEREGSSNSFQLAAPVRSPALIGRRIFLGRNDGRWPAAIAELNQLRQTDQFQCVEPTLELYKEFKHQYNRTFRDDVQDELERVQWFRATLRRAILLNRVVQEALLDRTIAARRNYHFIEPKYGDTNLALWYADITDCELGLLKHNMFRIFRFVDENQLKWAYEIIQEQAAQLPALTTDDGLEQLAEILLVRLFDRFRGDTKMNQLFQWPLYLKKLASWAYAQAQARQPDFKAKLELVSFAYPAYFKDLKYSQQALNRTSDNLQANKEHTAFYQRHGRQFKDLMERNRRLAIFRQRWTLVQQLNGEPPEGANSTRHLLPEWLSFQQAGVREEDQDTRYEFAGGAAASSPLVSGGGRKSDKLISSSAEAEESYQANNIDNNDNDQRRRPFRLTQFSDLTDLEFQAFLSNDFSLLGANKDSADYLDRNFPLRPLDARLRWEVAHELELRRGVPLTSNNLDLLRRSGQLIAASDADLQQQQEQQQAPSLRLAKQVVDELISDVGLPVGPLTDESISEQEHVRVFQQVANFWQKPYMLAGSGSLLAGPTSAALFDERTRRFDLFRQQHGRFRAWFVKDGWRGLGETRTAAMLRLADMTWLEIKLTLFKVCCLSEENLMDLSTSSATLQYLGSNYKLLCEHMAPPGDRRQASSSPKHQQQSSISAKLQEQHQQQQQQQHQQPGSSPQEAAEMAALELYYYYSVHFNKHHLNREQTERRFTIFRRNIEGLRRHSCKRSLTLYEALKANATELLNTMDVLDPRRSFTDDLNLDRFEYFSLPGVAGAAGRPQGQEFLYSLGPASARLTQQHQIDTSRSGVSYRRDFFAPLLERGGAAQAASSSAALAFSTHARLQDSWQDAHESAAKYRENSVASVYELVANRYKFCMRETKGLDLGDAGPLRLKCKSDGALGDQTVQLGSTHDFLQLGNQQATRESCAFYFQGLDAWADDLIPQEAHHIDLITKAKCRW